MAKLAGTVAPRLNHYETLGVSPTAAGDEIARAFARQGSVYRAHTFGGLAEVCIAYETLRDPIKRRAYDASLGLKRERSLPTAPIAQGVKLQASVPRPPIDSAPPQSQPEPALRLGPTVDSHVKPEPRLNRGSSLPLSIEEELGIEASPVDLGRAGFVLGGVAAAACILGGLAGWWSSATIGEPSQPENIVSLSLPPTKPVALPETAPTVVEPAKGMTEVRTERQKPLVAATAPIENPPIAVEPNAPEGAIQETEPASLSSETATEAPTTPAVAASMPLPDRVIARTIERIGYSCGSVASTAPVEGEAPGVFKIACSSGQSYRASPVNGRYRFKRWDRR